MDKSQSIASLAAALSAAQGEMQPAKMSSVNPFLKNKYADLGEIILAARHVLAKNGLAVSQSIFTDKSEAGLELSVETLLMHSSGEYLGTTVTLPVSEAKGLSMAQSIGAVSTYLRRYSLAALLCVYADEDADGNDKGEKKAAVQPPKADVAPVYDYSALPEVVRLMTSSTGVKYIDLTDEELSARKIGLKNRIGKPETLDDARIDGQTRLGAIKAILDIRNA